MTDEELVKKAQNGDKTALETLLKKYMNVVRAISRRFFLYGEEKEDLVQEGMCGLYSAIESYSTDKSLFSTYSRSCIRNRILDAVKSNRSLSNSALNDFSPIVEVGEELFGAGENPETELIKREDRTEFLQKISTVLSSFEFQVVVLYIDGLMPSAIAQTLNKDIKSINNALSRSWKKLSNLF